MLVQQLRRRPDSERSPVLHSVPCCLCLTGDFELEQFSFKLSTTLLLFYFTAFLKCQNKIMTSRQNFRCLRPPTHHDVGLYRLATQQPRYTPLPLQSNNIALASVNMAILGLACQLSIFHTSHIFTYNH